MASRTGRAAPVGSQVDKCLDPLHQLVGALIRQEDGGGGRAHPALAMMTARPLQAAEDGLAQCVVCPGEKHRHLS